MKTVRCALLLIAAVMILGSCGDERADEASPDRSGTAPNAMSAGRGDGVAETSGTPDASGDMMARMELHLHTMMAAEPDSMTSLVPVHRQMTANMIAQANREMGDMNMIPDSAWVATVDSLRTDLTRLPEMSGAELEAFMPGHHGRVMRLMEAHRTMMVGPEP